MGGQMPSWCEIDGKHYVLHSWHIDRDGVKHYNWQDADEYVRMCLEPRRILAGIG